MFIAPQIPRKDLRKILEVEPDLLQILRRHIVVPAASSSSSSGEDNDQDYDTGDLNNETPPIFLEELDAGSMLVPTLGGEFVTLTKDGDGAVTVTSSVGVAKVLKADILADNGVIHIIDGVL